MAYPICTKCLKPIKGDTFNHICEEIGKKYDSDKVRMDLLPFDSLEEIAKVLTFGAKKYGENNWKLVDNPLIRYEAALLRHITAYKNGELLDQETGLPHLAHAGCCLLFMISFEHGKLNK